MGIPNLPTLYWQIFTHNYSAEADFLADQCFIKWAEILTCGKKYMYVKEKLLDSQNSFRLVSVLKIFLIANLVLVGGRDTLPLHEKDISDNSYHFIL